MGQALEGQRKLVREVHHRVKNNLQVIASLLNIHRRSARSDDAQNAYSSIGRRVDALAVVHRNHYAELEENRGIALRPLISELASNLRGSAPESARRIDIGLDLESLNTTQDVAVATAFLTTEIVEHAMLTRPDTPVTLTLRRSATSRLASPLPPAPCHRRSPISGRAPAIRADHLRARQAAPLRARENRRTL
jgi:two-component sensor histidine kinase